MYKLTTLNLEWISDLEFLHIKKTELNGRKMRNLINKKIISSQETAVSLFIKENVYDKNIKTLFSFKQYKAFFFQIIQTHTFFFQILQSIFFSFK